MPKKAWNITKFNEGLNLSKNSKDIEGKGFEYSKGYLSLNEGSIATEGLFARVQGLINSEGCFQENYSYMGTPNLYKVFPEIGFRRIGKAVFDSTANAWKEQDGQGGFTVNHGLDVGVLIRVIAFDSNTRTVYVGAAAHVTSVDSYNQFKLAFTTTVSPSNGNEIYYGVNQSADEIGLSRGRPSIGLNANKFLFRASGEKFGFFNIGINKYWFGRAGEYTQNCFGNDPWYFDTRYLWDTQQHARFHQDTASLGYNKIYDAFYEDGVFRVLNAHSGEYAKGRCRRPVGLYSIEEEQSRFNAADGYKILPGWYALRQHILKPEEYHRGREQGQNYDAINSVDENLLLYKGAGTYQIDEDAFDIATFQAAADDPVGATYTGGATMSPYQISLVASHGGANGASGDWQFPANTDHEYIKLGMSLLYDTTHDEFAQESGISVITNGTGTDSWIQLSGGSPETDKALKIYYQFYAGTNEWNQHHEDLLEDGEDRPSVLGVPEFRGSGMNSGYSNDKCWSPRVVGARLWLMGDYTLRETDSTTSTFNDYEKPLFLAKIIFGTAERSTSHDGHESTAWTENGTGIWGQMLTIPQVPVLTFDLINNFKHDTNTQAWYRTHAIVNRKLYAGHVSYYDKTKEDWEKQISTFPDRILVSPPNKFDLLPVTNYLDLVRHDGQDIVKLIDLGSELLIFKHEDMFVVDCSGEFEILKSSHHGLGIQNAMQVCKTGDAIFWVNSTGVYGYDGENAISNVIDEKMDVKKWQNEIYNDATFIAYEPQTRNLLVFSRYQGEHGLGNGFMPNNMFMISTRTGAIFYKDEISTGNLSAISSGCVQADNYLYSAQNAPNNRQQEYISFDITTANVPATRQRGRWEIELVIDGGSGYDYQFYGNNLNRLLIRHQNTATETNNWQVVNAESFSVGIANPDTTTEQGITDIVSQQCAHLEETLNDPAATNSNYVWTVDASIEPVNPTVEVWRVRYYIDMYSIGFGTSFNITHEDSAEKLTALSEHNEILGTTAMAFSSDATAGNIRVPAETKILTFRQLFNSNGVASVQGVWNVWVDRNQSTAAGINYQIVMSYGNFTNDESTVHTFNITYLSAHNHTQNFNHGGQTSGSDCNTIGNTIAGSEVYTNAYNSKQATTNLRIMLMNNHFDTLGDPVLMTDYFTFGNLTEDTDGSVTGLAPENNGDGGTHKYGYFTMTMNETSDIHEYSTIVIEDGKGADVGGQLYRFNSSEKHTSGNTLITKDLDFGQPNIRKKVYRAYVNYKTDISPAQNMQVEYMVNGDGVWTDAILKDSNGATVTYVPASTEWSKFTIEAASTVPTNSIYSIKYKIVGVGFVEIDDISVIYREKPPR